MVSGQISTKPIYKPLLIYLIQDLIYYYSMDILSQFCSFIDTQIFEKLLCMWQKKYELRIGSDVYHCDHNTYFCQTPNQYLIANMKKTSKCLVPVWPLSWPFPSNSAVFQPHSSPFPYGTSTVYWCMALKLQTLLNCFLKSDVLS